MILRFPLLLAGFLFYTFQTLAQAYEPGLLVRSNGDTLRGAIENGFWVEPPPFIRFRATPEGLIQQFQPRQLRAVVFNSGRYFRYEVLPIDHAAETQLDHLPHGPFINVKVDSLLADVLVDGPISLLRVGKVSTTHYLLSGLGKPVLDMSARRYFSTGENGAVVIVDGNNYRNQLGLYFADCPAASSAAQKAAFTPTGLAGVVQAYNTNCTAARQPGHNLLVQNTPRRKVAFQGGLLAGVRYNFIKGPSETCADCKLHPFGGLYGEIFLPNRTLAFYGELSVSTFQGLQGYYTLLPGPKLYDVFGYRAWLGTARLGLRYYRTLAREQQLLVGFGVETNTVRSPVVTTAPGPADKPDLQYLEYDSPTLLPNIVVGWRAQRVTLSADVQMYSDLFDDSIASRYYSSNFAMRLGVSYRLGHNPDITTKRLPTAP